MRLYPLIYTRTKFIDYRLRACPGDLQVKRTWIRPQLPLIQEALNEDNASYGIINSPRWVLIGDKSYAIFGVAVRNAMLPLSPQFCADERGREIRGFYGCIARAEDVGAAERLALPGGAEFAGWLFMKYLAEEFEADYKAGGNWCTDGEIPETEFHEVRFIKSDAQHKELLNARTKFVRLFPSEARAGNSENLLAGAFSLLLKESISLLTGLNSGLHARRCGFLNVTCADIETQSDELVECEAKEEPLRSTAQESAERGGKRNPASQTREGSDKKTKPRLPQPPAPKGKRAGDRPPMHEDNPPKGGFFRKFFGGRANHVREISDERDIHEDNLDFLEEESAQDIEPRTEQVPYGFGIEQPESQSLNRGLSERIRSAIDKIRKALDQAYEHPESLDTDKLQELLRFIEGIWKR